MRRLYPKSVGAEAVDALNVRVVYAHRRVSWRLFLAYV